MAPENNPVGLCLNCAHAKRIESARGSVFYLCLRSKEDLRFPKYPPLPVKVCAGYEGKGRKRRRCQ